MNLFPRKSTPEPRTNSNPQGTLEQTKELTNDFPISMLWKAIHERGKPTKSSDYSLQSPYPGGPDPSNLTYQKLQYGGGFQVKINKKAKKKNLFRFLLAKGLYEIEGWHLDEYIVLWHLYLEMLSLLEKDPSFREKYHTSFENMKHFFKSFGTSKEFPVRLDIENPKCNELCQFLSPLLPTKSAYFGLRKQRDLRLGFKLVFAFQLSPQRVKEARYIGVGYRDQGTKKPEHSSELPFSEVESHFREIEIRSEEEYQGISRDDTEFDWNRLWGLSEVEKPKEENSFEFPTIDLNS